jgi:methionyl-tRNA formyltransferase
MGTPELAATSLRALLTRPEFQVVAVVTQPDQPRGRGLKLQPSAVKEVAQKENLPVLQPQRAREENFTRQLADLRPELIAVAAYGQILPKTILDLPRFGCLNVHTSLLPKYRGAAPIQHAILNGDAETGVTIMKMDVGLDTGDMLAQDRTPIAASDNAQTLHDRLARIGADLLVRTIPDFVSGKIQPRPQPAEGVTHAPKIKKHDGEIHWTQPAEAIRNRVRAMIPWPGAFTHLPGQPHPFLLKIWDAEVVAAAPSSPSSPRSGGEGRGENFPKAIARVEPLNPAKPTASPPSPPRSGGEGRGEVPQEENPSPASPVHQKPGNILQADKNGIVVGCGVGALRILVLQREGGRRMSAAEFLAGHPLKAGQSCHAAP